MEVIYAYTRAQALEDGVLVDAGALAREAGFSVPVALTEAAWAEVVTTSDADAALGQSVTGRLWDVLMVLRFAARTAAGESELSFEVSVRHNDRSRNHQLKAVMGPGDDAEPVLTVMLPGED
jgi:hypothetical protein